MSSRLFQCKEHTVHGQHLRGYYRATAVSEEALLRLAVKQYIPLDNLHPRAGDITVIAAHPAGFCKELYEPFFDEIYKACRLTGDEVRIRSVWIADVVTHGASAVLNEGKLGIDYCWDDHARDLLCMINEFRHEMPRPIVGLANSMGATNIVQLALLHPTLFSTIICVEPTIKSHMRARDFAPVLWLSERQDVWASREEALLSSRRDPRLKHWDQRVLGLWKQYGFRDLPTYLYPEPPEPVQARAKGDGTQPVTFATTKHHEARAYSRDAFPNPSQPLSAFQPRAPNHLDLTKEEHTRIAGPLYLAAPVLAFHQLPFLRTSCLYIYGDKSLMASSGPEGRAEKLATTGTAMGGSGGAKAGKVEEVLLEGVGHLAPYEKPAMVAEQTVKWLLRASKEWKEQGHAEREGWDRVDEREKAKLDANWMAWVKQFYGRSSSRLRDKL